MRAWAHGSKSDWELGMDAAPTVRLVGTVVDAESNEPLSSLHERRGTSPYLVGEGHAGRFNWSVSMAFHDKFSLEVVADGYETAVTDIPPRQGGNRDF